jgi:hypothetical protein
VPSDAARPSGPREPSARPRPEPRLPFLLVAAAAVLAGALALRAELVIGHHDWNDGVFHLALADRLVQAIERGENPLDFWVGGWNLGYPVARTYPTLAHLALAGLYFALGRSVPLVTVFVWMRYLLVVLFPLTVYGSARLLRVPAVMAAAAALVAPLVATHAPFGLDYSSYVWRGRGVFPQMLAMHLLLLAVGLAARAVREGRGLAAAGIVVGLTFLSDFVYGWAAFWTLVIAAALVGGAAPWRRVARVAGVGLAATAVTGYQVWALFADRAFVSHGRWEPAWSRDSFGLAGVLLPLARGEMLDDGRLPVLSLLALAGLVVAALAWRRAKGATGDGGPARLPRDTAAFILCGAAAWLLLYAGRPAWGPLLTLLGTGPELHLSRLVGVAQAFLVLLAGVGLGTLWRLVSGRSSPPRMALATALAALVLLPAARERLEYLALDDMWGRENTAAFAREQGDLDATIAELRGSEGRVDAGQAAPWGRDFKIGAVPFSALLPSAHVPAMVSVSHAASLPSDLMARFDERNPVHYRLFDVTTVVSDASRSLPSFLQRRDRVGRFQIWEGPARGWFDLVDVPLSVDLDRSTYFDVNAAWLASPWPASGQYLRLNVGRAPLDRPRLAPGESLPPPPPRRAMGTVESSARDGDVYRARVAIEKAGYLLFKMTYHPAWRARVDGARRDTVMLSPGFVGVPVRPGDTSVELRYTPSTFRAWLLGAGLLLALGLVAIERRGLLARLEGAVERVASGWWLALSPDARHRIAVVAGLSALALPAGVALCSDHLMAGHDALSYVARLVEFHENVRHGILLPRWAPDLSSGYGQPLLLFNPPLFYYVAEVWYLLGAGLALSLQLSALLFVGASAAGMYLLGTELFGRRGGWLAAAAYVYAPYFLVDLYVRTAFAELAAFPFYAFTLYGFLRHARDGRAWPLAVGAFAYAGVLLTHNPSALLFSPLLLCVLALRAWQARSWALAARSAAGVAMGLALSAFAWLPTMIERQFASLHRLLERYLTYTNHMVYPSQLLYSPWGYGQSVPGRDDGMSFALGWPLLVLAALAFVSTRSAAVRRWQWVLAAALATYSFLMTPAALGIWGRLPLLQYVAFAWRMLAPAALCLALLVGSLGPSLAQKGGRWMAAALALVVLPMVGHARPERYLPVDPAEWSPRAIAFRGAWASTAFEYEPRWVKTWLPFRPDVLRVVGGKATVSGGRRSPIRLVATVTAAEDAVLEVGIYYFPGWEARVDGVPTPLTVDESTGVFRLRVPAGRHRVEIAFRRTWPRVAGEALSVLALIVLAALLLRSGRRRSAPPPG